MVNFEETLIIRKLTIHTIDGKKMFFHLGQRVAHSKLPIVKIERVHIGLAISYLVWVEDSMDQMFVWKIYDNCRAEVECEAEGEI